MRVDIYARTSTQHQDVMQQVSYLRQWVLKNGYQIASETIDQQSAKVDLKDRTQFLNLLKNPKGEAMLVYNLDRLTRNWDSVTFIEKTFRENWDKYKLISTADEINLSNAAGRLMFRIKLAVNCHMPEDMLEKQAIGIARAKSQGKFKGRQKGAKSKANNGKLDMINKVDSEVKNIELDFKTKSGKYVKFKATRIENIKFNK